MTIEEKFPGIVYEMIGNDSDDPRTFAYFAVPRGCWYSTDGEPEAKLADKDMSIYLGSGILKIVDPNTDPPEGVCYYWT